MENLAIRPFLSGFQTLFATHFTTVTVYFSSVAYSIGLCLSGFKFLIDLNSN